MVAGWDHLLPAWFTRLHPTYRTPVNSILFVGAVTLAIGLASIVGVGEQEAFQLLNNGSGIFYALTYLLMFALPIAGIRGATPASMGLRLAALSGLAMTLLYIGLSIFPIVRVDEPLVFALKISGVVVAANGTGAVVFLIAARRRVNHLRRT
jgi:amino acid transporter